MIDAAIATSMTAEGTGIDWRHKLTGRVDYQHANGVTTREQFLGRYGRNESRIAGLVGIDFDWNLTDRLKLTQDTNAVAETGSSAIAIIDSRNTSVDLITGLNARINSSLSARFSYGIEYDSNPPPGAVQTDTLSRMALIYDF